jgi:hypothetical protein
MSLLQSSVLERLVKLCFVTWMLPNQVDADPDADDDDCHTVQALDNLIIDVTFDGFDHYNFSTCRRFTIRRNSNNEDVILYADHSCPWDAHHDLSPLHAQLLQAVLDFEPQKLEPSKLIIRHLNALPIFQISPK